MALLIDIIMIVTSHDTLCKSSLNNTVNSVSVGSSTAHLLTRRALGPSAAPRACQSRVQRGGHSEVGRRLITDKQTRETAAGRPRHNTRLPRRNQAQMCSGSLLVEAPTLGVTHRWLCALLMARSWTRHPERPHLWPRDPLVPVCEECGVVCRFAPLFISCRFRFHSGLCEFAGPSLLAP